MLENELELADGTECCGEGDLQVLDSLDDRIGALTLGRWMSLAEADANGSESKTKPGEEMVNGLQSEGGLEAVNGLANGAVGQELDQDQPEQRGAESVAGQDVGQEDRESVTASTSLPTI